MFSMFLLEHVYMRNLISFHVFVKPKNVLCHCCDGSFIIICMSYQILISYLVSFPIELRTSVNVKIRYEPADFAIRNKAIYNNFLSIPPIQQSNLGWSAFYFDSFDKVFECFGNSCY